MFCDMCKGDFLVQFAETPRDWDSDAYVNTAKTRYCECKRCGALFQCVYAGDSPSKWDKFVPVGRLTKEDILKNADRGSEWVRLARVRNIVRCYRDLQESGNATSEAVYRLLLEWNPPGMSRVTQENAIETMSMQIRMYYPLLEHGCKALAETRARMNRILGVG